jgi:hypothetical protein
MVMRTAVVLVAGQGDTDSVTGALMQRPGTAVVEHRFDGHVVRRTTALRGALLTDDESAEPATWVHYDDPFGDWYEDPCNDAAPVVTDATPAHRNDEAS